MILTLEQIYQHYEHIAKITLVSDNTNEFWTHQIGMYLAENKKDYVLIEYHWDDSEEDNDNKAYIFPPDTRFEVLWRDYDQQIATHQKTIDEYVRLKDESIALQARLANGDNDS